MCVHSLLRGAIGLALAQCCFCAAAEEPVHTGRGVNEIPDPELALMRGRYTVGGDAVAWFGVSMISTWQTSAGQTLQGTLTLGMDTRGKGSPVLSFVPSVSITSADAPLPQATATASRSVDSSGLQNVSGMVQSIQLAGDGNVASNVADLRIHDGDVDAVAVTASASTLATATSGDATATARYADGKASVQLDVAGQGQVQQWIGAGSVGQSIALGADAQMVSNRLQIDLVRQSLADNAPLSQNVAQSIALARGVGVGVGR